MQLSKEIVNASLASQNISLPAGVWNLPEKILQFGTGVLLRGLPDYYINKANNNNKFNGRIVVVKSTNKGSSNEFATQNSLYTHCIKGIINGRITEEYTINAAISRVINAGEHWQDVLQYASNPQLQIIISNTTEVGIALLQEDNIRASPPQSFPGKLLAFLYARYKAFQGSRDSGLVIIPTELIADNGKVLKDIVYRLAQLNHLEESFVNWLLTANDWCSSLVDRIVPGALPENDKLQLQQKLGYTDNLAIMSEPYNLWAIETVNGRTKQLLSFSAADSNIVITHNIQKYRELKLRLLNGSHTFSCGLAFLYQFDVVNTAMQDETFHQFLRRLIYQETIPCIIGNDISKEEAEAFAGNVLSRFANPFIQHQWLAITLQYTSKMRLRCVPLITRYYHHFLQPPKHIAIGFAAYLLFMKATVVKDNKYYGERNGNTYLIQDDKAARFYEVWKNNDAEAVVSKTLADAGLWGEDLSELPLFKSTVLMYLQMLLSGSGLHELLVAAL